MAKQQSFADKSSKKKGKSLGTFVKYIKSVFSEKTRHWRFNEQIVNIKDGENLDSALKRIDDENQSLDIEMPADNVEAPVEEEAPAEEEAPVEEEAPAEEEAVKKAKDTDSSSNES